MNTREAKQRSDRLLHGGYFSPEYVDTILSGKPFRIYGFSIFAKYDGIYVVPDKAPDIDLLKMGEFKDDIKKAGEDVEKIRKAGQQFIDEEMSTFGGRLWTFLIKDLHKENIDIPLARTNGFSRLDDCGLPEIFCNVEPSCPAVMENPFTAHLVVGCAKRIFETSLETVAGDPS